MFDQASMRPVASDSWEPLLASRGGVARRGGTPERALSFSFVSFARPRAGFTRKSRGIPDLTAELHGLRGDDAARHWPRHRTVTQTVSSAASLLPAAPNIPRRPTAGR
ncbi:hypothetical protein MTO96_022717 [Rhipicephalus appendiculatus]